MIPVYRARAKSEIWQEYFISKKVWWVLTDESLQMRKKIKKSYSLPYLDFIEATGMSSNQETEINEKFHFGQMNICVKELVYLLVGTVKTSIKL